MSNADSSSRLLWLDSLRGIAIVAMMAYHFVFDLSQQGWITVNMYEDTRWIVIRSLIVSLFVWIAGLSLTLRPSLQGFMRRWAQLFTCALAVTLGSWVMFPQSYIFFGVLHFFCVASLVGVAVRTRPRLSLILGVIIFGLGLSLQSSFFDQPYWQWLGMMTHKPITEDYVPIFPWLGVYCLGMACGHRLKAISSLFKPLDTVSPYLSKPLHFLGQRSLRVYMLHQPIFLAFLWLLSRALT